MRANQQDETARGMEETMRRIVIITSALLVSTLGVQASPQKVPHHSTHRQARGGISACLAGQRADADLFAALGNLEVAREWRTQCMPVNKSAPPPSNNDPYIPGVCD